VDFTAEVERSLRVLDGGVVIFSAREGVEAQSETVWRQADKYHVPRICFINKMDRIGASFDRTFEQIRTRLGAHPVALQIPLGAGSPPDPNALRGIVDLIERKALYFNSAEQGAMIEAREIPEEFREQAESARKTLLESVAILDDQALNTYMETDDLPAEVIHRLLRKATVENLLQPVLCGASLNYIGVQPLLDAVVRYLPSPLDVPPVRGVHPNAKKIEPEIRKPDPQEPFCGLVFKIVADQHGDLCFVRVYSGVLSSRARMLNPRTGKKELISQLWHIQASSREKVEEVSAGDIVGVVGPKEVVTGDTLCDQQNPVLLESIQFPETVISMAVEPESSADRKKLAETLKLLARQDPTFKAREEDNGQTTISGMGELHLEVIRHRMERDFKLNVRVHRPRVSYRETIRTAKEVKGEFYRQAAGVTQRAVIRVRAEPFTGGEQSVVVENRLKPGVLPKELMGTLEQAIRDEAAGGGSLGFPLMHVKFTILDADYSPTETTDVAVQAAAMDAVRQALNAGGVVLLEPVMKLEVVTPEEFLGNIQSDLLARKAAIVSTEQRGELRVLGAEAPLARMFGYSTQVRSLSQGRASYSMEPLKYSEAPAEMLQEMMG
jgi:elongation factor G